MDKSRRNLLKGGVAAVGAASFVAGYSEPLTRLVEGIKGNSGQKPRQTLYGNALDPEYRVDPASGAIEKNPDQRVAFTVCYGCTTLCGVRVRIDERTGKVVRAVGNPYNPLSNNSHIDQLTPVKEALLTTTAYRDQGLDCRSTACARGNAVLAQIDSPHRITQCLKRVGKRGEGKWQTIRFEQLVEEIVTGGDLFGEGHVDGLAALNDPKTPLDPQNPEYGPKTNQLLVMEATDYGRSALLRRFSDQAFGTRNYGHHGSYCGLSFRLGTAAVMNDLARNAHVKPDYMKARFILMVGTAPSQAGNPFNRQGRLLAEARANGELDYIVVDPALNASVARVASGKARWISILPGTDTALGMALIRLLFTKQAYASAYLAIPNEAAALAAGEVSNTNATHLVIQEETHPRHGAFLRLSDLGYLEKEAQPLSEADHPMVIDRQGALVDAHQIAKAELFAQSDVRLADGKTVRVKTALSLLQDSAMAHRLEELSEICGVSVADFEHIASQLARHGRRAVVDCHGGMMHGAGFDAALSLQMLNLLLGNINRTGGNAHGGGKFNGVAKGPLYNLESFEGARKPGGVMLSRSRFAYEKTSEFKRLTAAGKNPYPARAPWRMLAPPVLTDQLSSALDGYPYSIKALIGVMANPFYGQAGLQSVIEEKFRDPRRLPLYVAIDAFITETNSFADYIVPDSVMYEVWGFTGAWSGVLTKMTASCWPVVEPRQDKTEDGQPVTMDSFFIAVSKRLGLKGFGKDAIPVVGGATVSLDRAEDFYLRAAANIAFQGEQPLPSASTEDIAFSGIAPLLPKIEAVLPQSQQGPVAHLYSRGGRYQPYKAAYKGEALGNLYKPQLCVWNETVATAIDSMTGKKLWGTARLALPCLADGSLMRVHFPQDQWPLLAFSYKSNIMSSYSIGVDRLRMIKPYNPVLVNKQDAQRFGIAYGDKIRIESPGGAVFGIALVTDGVKPGAIGIEHGFGHRELGARRHWIDRQSKGGNPYLAAGVNLNDLGFADPTRSISATWLESVSGAAVRQGLPVRISSLGPAASV